MKKNLSNVVRKLAANIQGLTDFDIDLLNNKAPRLVLIVKDNLESNASDPYKGLSDKDKNLLLAFVVYKRQNITTSAVDKPNSEDAAKILHDEVYDLPEKNKLEKINNDLSEQLNKAGLSVPTPKKVKDVKKNKGD